MRRSRRRNRNEPTTCQAPRCWRRQTHCRRCSRWFTSPLCRHSCQESVQKWYVTTTGSDDDLNDLLDYLFFQQPNAEIISVKLFLKTFWAWYGAVHSLILDLRNLKCFEICSTCLQEGYSTPFSFFSWLSLELSRIYFKAVNIFVTVILCSLRTPSA